MRARARPAIVDPLALVFAAVPAGEITAGEYGDAERARAALDARYPAGSGGLRAGYLVRRRRPPAAVGRPRGAGRQLLCFGIPREFGAGAVSWTALIPRRLRLFPRAVVIYRGVSGDTAGVACLARGVPLSIEAGAGAEGVDRSVQPADPALAREYAGAPRFLLVRRESGRGGRPGPAAPARAAAAPAAAPPAGAAAGAAATPAAAAAAGAPAAAPARGRGRVRVVRARRWPASDPVLTGRPQPRGSMVKTAAATAVLLAFALLLPVAGKPGRAGGDAPASAPHAGVPPAQVRDASGQGGGEGPVAPADRGGRAPQALLGVAEALSRHAEPLRVTALRAEGRRVWISGKGAGGHAVAATLAGADHLARVLLRSSRSPSLEAGIPGSFTIVVTVEAGPAVGETSPERAARPTRGDQAAGVRAAAALEHAGIEAVAFERAGAAERPVYRVRGFGPAAAMEAAVVGLAGLDTAGAVHRIELRRRPEGLWDIAATLGARAEGG